MFWKEKKEIIYSCPRCENLIECDSCGCQIDKRDAKTVDNIVVGSLGYSYKSNYCKRCSVPYDRTERFCRQMKERYYINMGEMECDEQGNLIGYKKI